MECNLPETLFAVEIRKSNPDDPLAKALIDELSLDLAKKTGRDGRGSFTTSDVMLPRSVFLIAMLNEEAVGCGALRPLDEKVCEIKRMYSRQRSSGIGTRVLRELEKYATEFGYEYAWLETGVENHGAVKFYERQGYRVRENFGRYKGRSECICFEKILSTQI